MKRMGKKEKCENLLWVADLFVDSFMDEPSQNTKREAEFLIMIAKEYLR